MSQLERGRNGISTNKIVSSRSRSISITSIDLHRSAAGDSGSMGLSTFKFENLPPELRFEIYAYVRPEGLWHAYWLNTRTRKVVQSRRKGRLPPLFQVSKRIMNEAMSFLLRRNWQIQILEGKVVTNFPLDETQLSLCEKLTITVERPPSPREYRSILETRRAVDIVVNWLNSYSNIKSNLKMHGIKVRLGSTGSDSPCVWNDFAMLTGPLSRLKKSYAPAYVSRRDIFVRDARSRQQCDHLEKVLAGGLGAEKRALEYQQAILDIRLAISRTKGDSESNAKSRGLRCDDIVGGVRRLKKWYSIYNVQEPGWLQDLHDVLKKSAKKISSEDFTRVSSDGNATFACFGYWVTGILTGFDPFRL